MSNYRYVIDSTFQPFTFQEMLAPYVVYKEAADKAEEHYIDLANKAGKFKALAEYLPEGSRAKALYEGYANDLETQAADFGRNGLTMMNKAALTDLRSRYAGEIGQLDAAQTKLDELIKARNVMEASGKSMIYANANPTIDDFLPGGGFNSYGINPDDLYIKGAAAGKAWSNRLFRSGDGGKTLGGYYRQYMTINGPSAATMNKFREDMSSNEDLNRAANDILVATGAAQNLTGDKLRQAKKNVINGIIDGAVTQYNVQVKEDRGVMSAAELDNSKRQWANTQIDAMKAQLEANKWAVQKDAEYRFDPTTGHYTKVDTTSGKDSTGLRSLLGGSGGDGSGGGGVAPNASNIFTPEESAAFNNARESYAKYFTKDSKGRVTLTKGGVAEYNRKTIVSGGSSITGYTQGVRADSPFKKFIDTLGGAAMMSKGEYSKVGSLWDKFYQQNGGWDATKRTEFIYKQDESEDKLWKNLIQTAKMSDNDSSLKEVKFDSKTNKYKETGDKLEMSEFNKDKYVVEDTRFSIYGNIVRIKNPDGEVKVYRMPKGINSTNEANRDKKTAELAELQKAVYEGKIVDKNGNEHILNEEQIAKAYRAYQEALTLAYLYHSQLAATNKTKPLEYNTFSY